MKSPGKQAATDQCNNVLTRNRVVIGIGLAVLLLIYGNARMVYVAFKSQPDCVPHLKESINAAGPVAAKSSC